MPPSLHSLAFQKKRSAVDGCRHHYMDPAQQQRPQESMRKKVKGQYHYGIIKTGKQESMKRRMVHGISLTSGHRETVAALAAIFWNVLKLAASIPNPRAAVIS